jgi:hypothetical protein
MSDLRTTLERGVGGATPPPDGLERMLRRRDRKRRNQRITAGAVGIAVFVAAISVAMTGGPFDRSQPSVIGGPGTGPGVTGPSEHAVAPADGGFVGLPNPEAAPSTPKHGRLVLHLGGFAGGSSTDLWVYADGRLIWGDGPWAYQPADAPIAGATGFVEQRITPAWVESLRTEVISTGLFEHDLALLDLLGPGDPNFLDIQVRNGDRLVWLTWAVKENGRVTKDSPTATPEQVSALMGILSLLSDPTSWPARAWENQDPETFVPSRYQVWLRAWNPQTGNILPEGERALGLLPTSATDIFHRGTKVGRMTRELTTDDVRALAEALSGAGLQPQSMPYGDGEAVLRYELDIPSEPGSVLTVFIGPVLPHGEAVFLGPG